MKLSTAVPLAVVTALLTLMSSGYLLGQSTSSSRANVVTGNDAGLLNCNLASERKMKGHKGVLSEFVRC